ncbi:MAG: glycoside hydrolase family 2, partial [Chitinophagaceae bacterium]
MSGKYFAFFLVRLLLIFPGLVLQLSSYCQFQSSSTDKSQDISSFSKLKNIFQEPGDAVQTSIYWYWISDNISKTGVIRDLHAMKKAGINRAFIGNIGLDETPYGKVKMFSDTWWDILHTALKTATDLNIEIGVFNSPGWSQSGGPWIKPEQAMRYLISSEVKVKGAQKLQIKLAPPIASFQDVRVIAYPTPVDEEKQLKGLQPVITASIDIPSLTNVSDGILSTEIDLPAGKSFNIDYKSANSFTARSITFYPAHKKMRFAVELGVMENNVYRVVKKYVVDRSNDALNVGFVPFAPAVLSIPATTSDNFRLHFSNVSLNSGLSEIEISGAPKIESYAEKTLAKMYPTPLPYWKEYQWPKQPEAGVNTGIINPDSVRDISRYMEPDGTLNWQVPMGSWTISRTGMTPTKVTNSPASKEATGLEVDKMSKKHVAAHFDAFLGQIIKRIPPEDRKTWKVTVEDSYETGGQNWTDGLIEKFRDTYGYDPLPYIPVLGGKVVGSADKSDRFLWDLRRFIADKVAYEYVGGLREISHKHGLTTWLENYGHWGFPGEFLQYGGQSDEIGGEFWSEGELGDIENRAASSAAHIYGKKKVSAESFTAGGKAFARYPALMKQRGDRFFTEGINNTLLHVYIQQPYEDKKPGVNAGFGNEFNRFNTWFTQLDLFTDYLKRCNYILQQGNYVADVAYFIGEDAPKMTGVQDPALPAGYSFDYINAEVIENRLTVSNGRLMLPDGLSYKILVLPKLKTMRPRLLAKIRELVNDGAVILGPRPDSSPGLENFPLADEELRRIASELWGDIDGDKIRMRSHGKGMVMDGINLQQAMDLVKLIPDFSTPVNDSILFIHRSVPDGDIYFLSNQGNKRVSINPRFRVTNKVPELWHPVSGEIRKLPAFTDDKQTMSVPLQLEALESFFLIFRNKTGIGTASNDKYSNFPDPLSVNPVNGPWQVYFDSSMRGPLLPVSFSELKDWTKHENENIRYYSGTAVYRNIFKGSRPESGQKILLDINAVTAMARIRINGKDVGGVWTAPYQVDITAAMVEGDNKLEIIVVNNWMNRLIGD